MKKIFSLLLVLTMSMFLLVGCGDDDNSANNNNNDDNYYYDDSSDTNGFTGEVELYTDGSTAYALIRGTVVEDLIEQSQNGTADELNLIVDVTLTNGNSKQYSLYFTGSEIYANFGDIYDQEWHSLDATYIQGNGIYTIICKEADFSVDDVESVGLYATDQKDDGDTYFMADFDASAMTLATGTPVYSDDEKAQDEYAIAGSYILKYSENTAIIEVELSDFGYTVSGWGDGADLELNNSDDNFVSLEGDLYSGEGSIQMDFRTYDNETYTQTEVMIYAHDNNGQQLFDSETYELFSFFNKEYHSYATDGSIIENSVEIIAGDNNDYKFIIEGRYESDYIPVLAEGYYDPDTYDASTATKTSNSIRLSNIAVTDNQTGEEYTLTIDNSTNNDYDALLYSINTSTYYPITENIAIATVNETSLDSILDYLVGEYDTVTEYDMNYAIVDNGTKIEVTENELIINGSTFLEFNKEVLTVALQPGHYIEGTDGNMYNVSNYYYGYSDVETFYVTWTIYKVTLTDEGFPISEEIYLRIDTSREY